MLMKADRFPTYPNSPPQPDLENERPQPAPGPQQERPLRTSSNGAQMALVIAAALAICYVGRLVLIPLAVAILLAFVLEPLASWLERIHLPRPLAAALAMLVFIGVLYGLSYVSYVKGEQFIQQMPKYSHQIRDAVGKLRHKAQQVQQASQAIAPDENKPHDGVVQVEQKKSGISDYLSQNSRELTDLLIAISFIPFIAYFMLSWKDHVRSATVMLFPTESRTNGYVALSRMAAMLRSFIVGNVVVGILMGLLSVLAFWPLHVPYFYFVGFISGFLSLVPYLGVVLAVVPPLGAGLGTLSTTGFILVPLSVFAIHLIGLNVFYPKILGKRLQLNPLVVTISLLLWWFLWGAVGLLLAIPVTAAMKIIFDHVEWLQPLGAWMGEGKENGNGS